MTDTDDLLLAFYGDDFTGSTDVMEALSRAGLRTVLFLRPPGPDDLRRFPGARAFGVAGVSRSLPTGAMEAELRPVFEALRARGAPLAHYKVCSTFDSSAEVGSIGRAIDIGQAVFASPFVPVVVGAPALGRYQVFGNLFARSGPETRPFRLDRHPTMRHHPTTPMDEADLRLHLGKQTDKRIGLFDILDAALPPEAQEARRNALLADGCGVVLFDVLTEDHLPAIGRLIASTTGTDGPLFVVGSSGVEYALVAHWKAEGSLPPPPDFAADPVEQIVVMSGSCSPVTERQIAWAVENGFGEVPLRPERLVDPAMPEAEFLGAVKAARRHLAGGRSVVLHTSRGPDDPRLPIARARLAATGHAESDTARLFGTVMGRVLREILLGAPRVRRAAVCGGDTSSFVARALGITALEMAAPMAPGSPLCRVHTGDALDGMQIVFKGGQVGKIDFFASVLRGTP